MQLSTSVNANSFCKEMTYPPWRATRRKIWMLSLLRLKDHWPICPSVLLKYALSAFFSGAIYQLPHRSFATKGSAYASATSLTNSESSLIDRSRLDMERVSRLSEPSVLLKLVASSLKIKPEVIFPTSAGSLKYASFLCLANCLSLIVDGSIHAFEVLQGIGWECLEQVVHWSVRFKPR
jgi:hypothetical protein